MSKQKNPGYHLAKIAKGELGELSKVLEEVMEAIDAENQDCKIMVLVELSDIIRAIELYLEKHHQNITINDLLKMSELTKRAFNSGSRK